MKKAIVMAIVAAMVFSSTAFGATKYNDIYNNVNVRAVSGELMIEARGIFEAMGYGVSWDSATKTTLFQKDGSNVSILTSTGAVTIDGSVFEPRVKPVIIEGVTYIPASLLIQMGVSIDWDFDKAYPILYSQDYTTTETTTEATTEAVSSEESEETTVADGWNIDKNKYYYNGSALTGTHYIDGIMYSFGTDGTLLKGVIKSGNDVYGYDDYGNSYNGFVTVDNNTYYFENGKAYTSPTLINGKMYNFNSDGYFNIGWVEANGNKYYNNEFGYPCEGIVEIEGAKYLFLNGIMQTGNAVYNNNSYLLNEDGTMVTNQMIGDTYYDVNGIGLKVSQNYVNLQNRVNSILSQIGTSPQAIYNYVVSHVSYKFMAQQDWTTMANTGFSTGRGACYNFAACVDILLKNSGYETRVVRGTGHFTSLHYWNQVKINGVWTNIDACNKYFNVSDAYLKSKTYTFNKYEYPIYY